VLDVIGIHELQPKVILLDDVQCVEYLFVQKAAQCLFLQSQTAKWKINASDGGQV